MDLEVHSPSQAGQDLRSHLPHQEMDGVVVTSPAIVHEVHEVLRDHDNNMANHEPLATAKVITFGGNDIVWAPNGPTWRMLPRICIHEVLSPISIEAVHLMHLREVRCAVSQLYNAGPVEVDVGPMVLLTILNVLTTDEHAVGATVEEEERDRISREFREVIEETVELLSQPNVGDFFPGRARFDCRGCRQRWGSCSRVHSMFGSVIERKKKEAAAAGKDLLSCMLKLEAEGGDSKATMTHVKALLVLSTTIIIHTRR